MLFRAVLVLMLSTGILRANSTNTNLLETVFQYAIRDGMELDVVQRIEAAKNTRWIGITLTSSDGGTTFSIPFAQMSDGSDDRNRLTLSPKVSIVLRPKGQSTEPIRLILNHEDLAIDIISAGRARAFEITGGKIDLASLGETGPSVAGKISGINAKTALSTAPNGWNSGTFSMREFSMSYALNDKDNSLSSTSNFKDASGSFSLPVISDRTQAWADKDQEFNLQYKTGAFDVNSTGQTKDGRFLVSQSGGASESQVNLSKGNFFVKGNVGDLVYRMKSSATGNRMFEAKVGKGAARITLPLHKQDTPQEAQIGLSFKETELGEPIWALFDPTKRLERGPADIDLDAEADVIWLVDPSKIELSKLAIRPPIQAEKVRIKKLDLNAVGVSVKSSGDIDLDNKVFPPSTTGTARITMIGIPQLLDKLAGIGIVSQEQVLGFRAMSPFLFRTDKNGAMVSQLELRDGGIVIANGIPLPIGMLMQAR